MRFFSSVLFMLIVGSNCLYSQQVVYSIWKNCTLLPVLNSPNSEKYDITIKNNIAQIYHVIVYPSGSRGYRPSDTRIYKYAIVKGNKMIVLTGNHSFEELEKMKPQELHSLQSDEWFVYDKGKYHVIKRENGKYLCCDLKQYTTNDSHYCGLVKVKNNYKIGFVDKSGIMVIPAIYDDAEEFSEGFASVKKDSKWGLIDINGNTIIPFKYSWMGRFKCGVVAVSESSDWIDSYFVNKNDKRVFDNKYYGSTGFEDEKVAQVRVLKPRTGTYQSYRETYIDSLGHEIVNEKYDNCESRLIEGLIVVEKNRKYGCVDVNGKERIPPVYSGIYSGKGNIIARKNDKYGYIDKNNNIILPFIYDNLSVDKEKIEFSLNGKYGIMTLAGDIIIEPKYDGVWIGESYCAVKVKKQGMRENEYMWGIVDFSGRMTVTPKYNRILLSGDYARIFYNNDYYYIKCSDGKYFADRNGFYEAPISLVNSLNR